MVAIKRGAVTFKSVKQAAKSTGIPYMTLNMRKRAGLPLFGKVRKYKKAA